MWHAKFNNGGDRFVALGENRDNMDVYRLLESGLLKTKISFPACLRFMPYVEIDEETAGRKTKKWIEETYGAT